MSKLLDVRETAKKLSVTTNTVRQWLREGQIKALRYPSGDWRILESDLNEFIKACYTGNNLPFNSNDNESE